MIYILLICQLFHQLSKGLFDVELAAQPISSFICMITNTCPINLYPASVVSWCLILQTEKVIRSAMKVK